MCQKYNIPPILWIFFRKKPCNFSAIVLLLYPTKAGCWIHTSRCPCFSFCFHLLIFAISFIYLLIIYPACLKGQKSDGPSALGHRFSFYLFCRQLGKRLPDVAGKIEGAEGTDRAVPAQLDGAGDPGGDVRSRFRPAAPGTDVLSQCLGRHGPGVWAATVTNCFASGSSSASISSTSLSAMMLSRKTNFCPGKRSRRLWTVARIPWALWLPSSRKAGACRSSSKRPGQLTCSRPVRMARSGMSQPLPRSTRRAVMARAAFFG